MLKPVTENLLHSFRMDDWPRQSAICDFGLVDQQHYEALYYPVRRGEVTPEQVDAVLGDGPKLTELVNSAPSNPHKGIVFTTPWDDM